MYCSELLKYDHILYLFTKLKCCVFQLLMHLITFALTDLYICKPHMLSLTVNSPDWLFYVAVLAEHHSPRAVFELEGVFQLWVGSNQQILRKWTLWHTMMDSILNHLTTQGPRAGWALDPIQDATGQEAGYTKGQQKLQLLQVPLEAVCKLDQYLGSMDGY